MVRDAILRHHASPVGHVGVVSECEDARSGELGREEGLGPRLGFAVGGPRPLAVAGEAMDEDNAGMGMSAYCNPLKGLLLTRRCCPPRHAGA